FFSSRRRHTRLQGDWSSDVCSSDLKVGFNRLSARIERFSGNDDDHGHAWTVAWFREPNDRVRGGLEYAHVSGAFPPAASAIGTRSEERRVGKEGRGWGARQR